MDRTSARSGDAPASVAAAGAAAGAGASAAAATATADAVDRARHNGRERRRTVAAAEIRHPGRRRSRRTVTGQRDLWGLRQAAATAAAAGRRTILRLHGLPVQLSDRFLFSLVVVIAESDRFSGTLFDLGSSDRNERGKNSELTGQTNRL